MTRRLNAALVQIGVFICLCTGHAFATDAPDMDALKKGLWIDRERLMQLPMEGPAWDELLKDAQTPIKKPDLTNQEEKTNVRVFARALVYARTGEDSYRDEVIAAIKDVMGTETRPGGRTLALGRNLMAYVLAADLVGLPPNLDERFRKWLRAIPTYRYPSGKTLVSTHEIRPNNWGTAAGASRIAVAGYLGDSDEIERAAQVFKGYLGDRGAYAGFKYKKVDWWQANPDKPVGINPAGATREGHSIDGVLPEEMRRGGPFTSPPPKENYVYTGLEGALAQAVLLERAGYTPFEWQNRALLRAFEWLYNEANFPAVGNDTWQPYLINSIYGTDFPVTVPSRYGKNIGYTDWTHNKEGRSR
ncbi:alginate lyase family protein [Halochromatium sp.]